MAGVNNVGVMPKTRGLSEAKRTLLQRYLRGEITQGAGPLQAIGPRPPGEPVPLSFQQAQLWNRAQREDIPALYNEVITIRRCGQLDVAALERSLADIVRRHEIWRTSYDRLNGQPIQVIHPAPAHFSLPVVDLRALPEAEIEAEARRLASEAAHRPFDLTRGPLWRATLVRTGDAEYQLCMVAHLSIIDGVSVYQVFPSELATLYTAFSAGKSSPLAYPHVQYGDYAYWQRQSTKHEKREEQLRYWRKQLAGELPVLQWPTDCPRPAVQSYRGAVRPFALSGAVTDALKELSAQARVTLFTILVASFSCLLHCYTRQVDLVIGTPSPAGRKRSEVQELLGYFLNPVPLRIDLEGNPSFLELLPRIQKTIAEAISYDDLPLDPLAKELQVKPDPSRNPFFTVAMSLQPKTPSIAQGWNVTSMDADSGGAVWDLYLAFIDRAGGMIGRVQYNPDLFETATITTMLEDLQAVMKAITADPGQRLSTIFKAA
jgi:hypothetical protein